VFIWIAIIAIAAALWWDMRQDAQRRRMVKNIESLLREGKLGRAPEQQFKRVA
jgi:hypothetical protein